MAGEFYLSGLSNTGFDYQSYLDKYRELEMLPVKQLQSSQMELRAKQKALSNIHNKLSAFRSYIDALSSDETYETLKAEVSDKDVISVSVENGAVESSYSVNVIQLARGNTYKVGTVSTITDVDQALSGDGTLTISYLKDGSSNSLSVDYSGKSLREVMDEINSSEDLRASIINLGTSSSPDYQLIVSPVETGLENRITGIDDSLNPGDDSGGVFSEDASKTYETRSAQDAKIEVNGVEFESASNEFDSIITGVSITAKSTGSSNVNIVRDNSKVELKVKSILKAYNELSDAITSATGKDGALSGEFSLNSISRSIFRIISDELGRYGFIDVEGNAETTKGHLKVDDDVFNSFMEREDAKDILKGFASALDAYIENYDTDLGNRENRYEERISYIGRRINLLTENINREIERLRLKFARLETYLSQMQSLQARIEAFARNLNELHNQRS